jgi:hypothetical protein
MIVWNFTDAHPLHIEGKNDDEGDKFNARYNRLIEKMDEWKRGYCRVHLPSFLWLYLRADE